MRSFLARKTRDWLKTAKCEFFEFFLLGFEEIGIIFRIHKFFRENGLLKYRENWRKNSEKSLIWPNQIYISLYKLNYKKEFEPNYLEFFEKCEIQREVFSPEYVNFENFNFLFIKKY